MLYFKFKVCVAFFSELQNIFNPSQTLKMGMELNSTHKSVLKGRFLHSTSFLVEVQKVLKIREFSLT